MRKKWYLVVCCFALLGVSSCTMGVLDPPQAEPDEKVLVSIGVQNIQEINGRTVLPTVSFSDITLFELWGGFTYSAEEMLLSIDPQSITNQTAVVAVDSGTWNFTLKAYKGSDRILEGKKVNVSISSDSDANLEFSLVPVSEGYGSVHVTIALPESSGVAAVITLVNGTVVEPALEIVDNAIVYTQDHIDAGDYFITFQLQDTAGELLAVVSEILQIRSSLLSEKTITLEPGDFNAGPEAPSNLKVSVIGSTEETVRYRLEWDDNSNNETGFVLDDGTTEYAIEGGRNTSQTFEGAVGTTITYRIKGVNAFGESNWTELTHTLVGGSGTELPAPTGVVATAQSSRSIRIQWDPVGGASEYRIYRVQEAGSDDYIRVGTTDGDTCTYTDTGLAGNTTYYYQVSAVNEDGAGSAFSSSAQGTTYPVATTPPSVPGGITGWSAGPTGGTTLTWDSVDTAIGYYIYRSTYEGGYTNIGTSSTTSYTDTEATPSTYYYYKVSAYNDAGESELSGYSSGYTYPSVPTGITAGATSSSSITVSWNSTTDASYYYIYRSETSEGSYSYIGSQYYYGTSCTDSSVNPGTTYYYKVSVYNNSYGYEGALSPYAAALTYPGTPSSLQAGVNASNRIVVSWAAVTGASSYKIYRSSNYYSGYAEVGTIGSTSYTDTTVAPSNTYYYKVSAVNESGEGSQSDYTSVSTHAGNSISATIDFGSDVTIASQTLEIPKGTQGTFSVPDDYTGYQWYLNGSLIQDAVNATYTLETGAMTPGIYELTVVVRSTAGQFSGTCRMRVIN